MATALPSGWVADYDGQRWFYLYQPTGFVQYHFPREGDEFLSALDESGPPPSLSVEELLESQRQVKRNHGQSRPQTSRPKSMCDLGALASSMSSLSPNKSNNRNANSGPGNKSKSMSPSELPPLSTTALPLHQKDPLAGERKETTSGSPLRNKPPRNREKVDKLELAAALSASSPLGLGPSRTRAFSSSPTTPASQSSTRLRGASISCIAELPADPSVKCAQELHTPVAELPADIFLINPPPAELRVLPYRPGATLDHGARQLSSSVLASAGVADNAAETGNTSSSPSLSLASAADRGQNQSAAANRHSVALAGLPFRHHHTLSAPLTASEPTLHLSPSRAPVVLSHVPSVLKPARGRPPVAAPRPASMIVAGAGPVSQPVASGNTFTAFRPAQARTTPPLTQNHDSKAKTEAGPSSNRHSMTQFVAMLPPPKPETREFDSQPPSPQPPLREGTSSLGIKLARLRNPDVFFSPHSRHRSNSSASPSSANPQTPDSATPSDTSMSSSVYPDSIPSPGKNSRTLSGRSQGSTASDGSYSPSSTTKSSATRRFSFLKHIPSRPFLSRSKSTSPDVDCHNPPSSRSTDARPTDAMSHQQHLAMNRNSLLGPLALKPAKPADAIRHTTPPAREHTRRHPDPPSPSSSSSPSHPPSHKRHQSTTTADLHPPVLTPGQGGVLHHLNSSTIKLVSCQDSSPPPVTVSVNQSARAQGAGPAAGYIALSQKRASIAYVPTSFDSQVSVPRAEYSALGMSTPDGRGNGPADAGGGRGKYRPYSSYHPDLASRP